MHDILMLLKTVGPYIYHEVTNNLPAIGAFIGGGGLLSTEIQIRKRIKQWDSADKIHKFLAIDSLLVAIAGWYLTNLSTHFAHAITPIPAWLGMGSTLFVIATALHKYPVSQLDAKLTSYFGPIFQAAEQLKAEAAPTNKTVNEVPASEPTSEFKIEG